MFQNSKFALIFRAGALLFALIGVMAQIGVFRGEFSFRPFMYYTIQSNLLVIALFAMLTIRTLKSLRSGADGGDVAGYPRFEMVCTIGILVTFIVYWTLLSPRAHPGSLWTFENVTVHGITPLLCLADYIMFVGGGKIKYRDIYYACIFPIAYVIFSAAAGLMGYVYSMSLGSPFSSTLAPVYAPYFFLDYWNTGAMTAVYIGAILVFFILLGHGFYFFNKRMGRVRS